MSDKSGLKNLMDLSGIALKTKVRAGEPPSPPPTLSEDGKAIWREVVNSRPHDYFPPYTFAMLESYCHAVLRLNFLQKLWDKCRFEQIDPLSAEIEDLVKVKAMSEMVKDLQRQTSVVNVLARQLRITVLTTTSPESASSKKDNKFAHAPKKPWESEIIGDAEHESIN